MSPTQIFLHLLLLHFFNEISPEKFSLSLEKAQMALIPLPCIFVILKDLFKNLILDELKFFKMFGF